MSKIKKRIVLVANEKYDEVVEILKAKKIQTWNDAYNTAFHPLTAVITSGIWIAIIILVAILN